MKNYGLACLIALQFLTKLPINLPMPPTPQQNGLSIIFYPVVGLLMGGILFILASWLSVLPIMLSASLLLLAWVWLTGGLHLDGLADTVDGFVGGYGDKVSTLTIMKDPNCGAMGVIAIGLALLLKWTGIYLFFQNQLLPILLVVPMLGRLAILALFLTTPYVRKQGLGSALADYLPKMQVGLMLLLGVWVVGVLGAIWLKWLIVLIVLSVFAVVVAYLRWLFLQKIDGITGDTVGASVEIVEIMVMIVVIILIV